jgi:hypothetical protein
MLLGESFLFGRYVTQEQTIGAHLQQRLGDGGVVFNLAIPGWGLDQMYLAYRQYADRIRPAAVVLFYIDEDIDRVYQAFRKREGMSKPSFELVDGRLAPRRAGGPGVLTRIANWSYLGSAIHVRVAEARSLRLGQALVRELVRDTAARGQTLVVVRCPLLTDFERPPAPRRLIPPSADAAPALYVDLDAPMRRLPDAERRALYLEGDMHLSPAGCRYAAVRIDEALRAVLAPRGGA